VSYEFKRGKRRTIGFVVGPEGLAVRAPTWVALRDVDAALQERAHWIVKKLGETRARHERLIDQRIDWRNDALFPFLGQQVKVVLDPAQPTGAAGALFEAESPILTLSLALPQSAAPAQIRDAVQAWLMRQAKRIFTERLDHFAPSLQVKWCKLTLSRAATRWGSATVDGSIRLNWRLIHFKMAVIDYVVVHELSHLRVMNHSPRFWETVRSVLPDYVALRKQLKDDSVPH
jgi:predicted metal-dependent hydrolase